MATATRARIWSSEDVYLSREGYWKRRAFRKPWIGGPGTMITMNNWWELYNLAPPAPGKCFDVEIEL